MAEGRPHVDQAEVGRAGSDRAIGDNLAGEDHARGGVRLAGQALAAGGAEGHRADGARPSGPLAVTAAPIVPPLVVPNKPTLLPLAGL